MNFKDILELAKQGYTPSDIKELLSLSVNESDSVPQEVKKPDIIEDDSESENTTQVDTAAESQPEADSVDYKELFEKSQKTIDKLNRLLTSKNIEEPNQKSDIEMLEDLARSFM